MRISICTSQACSRVIVGLLFTLAPGRALAGGFENEQSTYFEGTALAGTAAAGPSISSMFWNPAAITHAESGLTTESSYSLIMPTAKLTVLNPDEQSLPGDAEVDMGRDAVSAVSFAAWRLDSKTVLGLSMTGPFGLWSKPDNPDWAGQSVAVTSKAFSLNLTPSVSYEIAPGVAIGAGVQFAYFNVNRQTAATPLGTSNLQGDDIGFGFTAGINLAPSSGTSIGLGFRSSIDHDLDGDISIIGLAEVPAEANLELPEKVTLSLRQAVSPTARLLGTVEWTNWSRLGVIPIVLQAPFGIAPAGTTIANLDFNWRDGWLFAVGAEYDWSRSLTLRAGTAYEVSPIDNATARLVQVPDSNRWWIAVGASYKWSDTIYLDFAYNHMFYQDAPFDRTPSLVDPDPVHLLGTADVSLDILLIGLRMRMGDPTQLVKSVQ